MSHRYIGRTAAAALAVAAMAAPAASARPLDLNTPKAQTTEPKQDLRNADNRGSHESVPAGPTQDLRSADTKDYAAGRGTYNAPEVVVVSAPAPKSASTGGIDWEDVGIGAGGLLAIVAIGAGGALILTHRRTQDQLAG